MRRRADYVVVVGRDMRERLADEGVAREKLVYVPTWAPADAADPAVSARLREDLGWTDRFVVMHARQHRARSERRDPGRMPRCISAAIEKS